MLKNAASQVVSFQMIAIADGSDVTSGTPAVYFTIDAGTQGTGTGTIAHEGNGQWSYSPVQAETNGNHVAFTMVLSGAISQTVNVYPLATDFQSTAAPTVTLGNVSHGGTGATLTLGAGNLTIDASNRTLGNVTGSLPANFGSLAIDGSGVVNSNAVTFDSAAIVQTSGKLWVLDGDGNAIAAAGELAKVPKSDGTVAFNSTAAGSIAASVEAAILDEGDATALLAAIAAKVEEFLVNEGDATATIAAIATACNSAIVAGTVGTNVGAIKAKTDNLPASPAAVGSAMTVSGNQTFNMTGNITGNLSGSVGTVSGNVTVGTNNDKTGYKLASDGLDSIAVTRPSAKATTFPGMLVQMFYRFFGKVVHDADAGEIVNYAADGTTPVTTQTATTAGNVETQGEAS